MMFEEKTTLMKVLTSNKTKHLRGSPIYAIQRDSVSRYVLLFLLGFPSRSSSNGCGTPRRKIYEVVLKYTFMLPSHGQRNLRWDHIRYLQLWIITWWDYRRTWWLVL